MLDFKDIFYLVKLETELIKTPRAIIHNYENFLIIYFKKFFPFDIDSVLEADELRFNIMGVNRIVSYDDFKKFNESLKFFTLEGRRTQFKLYFGGIIFNQDLQENLPKYKKIIQNICYFAKNEVKDILDIYSLKEAKTIADFLSAKINYSIQSNKFKLTLPTLINPFEVKKNEINGALLRQKQILNGLIFSLEQNLKYKEKFFYSLIEKREVPRKEALFKHLFLMTIGFIGCYVGDFFITKSIMEHRWQNTILEITSLFSALILVPAMIGLIIISENIIKVNKNLSYVDSIYIRKLSNYLDDNPFYFSSLQYDKNSIIGIEIMEMIALLKQFINYYDETLQLIDQLFDEDDLLPSLKLERFPSDLLKNSFFKLDRNPKYVPEFERGNNLVIR